MKYTLLFCCCLFTSWAAAQSLWFEDSDFEKNVNRWYQVEELGDYVQYNALYVDPDKDFRLVAEFDATNLTNNASYGISWGRRNAYSYYHFEVNTEQSFRVGYRNGLEFNALEPWIKKKKVITMGINTLEVAKKGSLIHLSVNGQLVYKMDYRKFVQSTIAMRSSNKLVKFNRFAIYQDRGEINIAKGILNEALVAENLGAKVNSKYVDKSPVISPDGKTLYFIREFADDGFGNQDIYFSTYEEGSGWSLAENIGRPLNNQTNNFVTAVMPDNNTIMAINSYTRSSAEEILAFTHRTPEGWSNPIPRKINGLRKTGRWVSFDLAADGKTIVYSMKRPNGYGGRDLYVSFLQPNGEFSPPRNLGKTINTMGNEHCPFLAADGKTLYFDTDGHAGYGGRDIFMTKRLDDSWTNWSVPQNLGDQINTKGADEGLVIPASGEYAYFVSDKNSLGGLDIYRLKLPEHLKPEPTALLTGYVVDCFSQKGIPTTIRVLQVGKAGEYATARTAPNNGGFKLALAGGAKYQIIADYNPALEINTTDTIEIDLTSLSAYEEQELDPICFQPKQSDTTKTKIPIRAAAPNFKSVYFNHDKYLITPKYKQQLQEMAATLANYPALTIEVLGHTDSNGSNEYNWTLAVRRSSAVIDYLVAQGVERTRFDFKGFGETKPIAENTTDGGRANNRRVEFRIK